MNHHDKASYLQYSYKSHQKYFVSVAWAGRNLSTKVNQILKNISLKSLLARISTLNEPCHSVTEEDNKNTDWVNSLCLPRTDVLPLFWRSTDTQTLNPHWVHIFWNISPSKGIRSRKCTECWNPENAHYTGRESCSILPWWEPLL